MVRMYLPLARRLIQRSPPGNGLSAFTPVMASSTEHSRMGQWTQMLVDTTSLRLVESLGHVQAMLS